MSENTPIIDKTRQEKLLSIEREYESEFHLHLLKTNAPLSDSIGINLEEDFYYWLSKHKKYLTKAIKNKSELAELFTKIIQ